MAIGTVIGKRLGDFDSMGDSEVNSFRRRIYTACEEAHEQRKIGGPQMLELVQFPPRLDESALPKSILTKLPPDQSIQIKVRCIDGGSGEHDFETRLVVKLVSQPAQIVSMALSKKLRDDAKAKQATNGYILKFVGREEYLLGNSPLSKFRGVRQALMKGYEAKDLSDILVGYYC